MRLPKKLKELLHASPDIHEQYECGYNTGVVDAYEAMSIEIQRLTEALYKISDEKWRIEAMRTYEGPTASAVLAKEVLEEHEVNF